MRYVPSACLREGMKVAKTLYGKNNERLLADGVILNAQYIDVLKRFKFPGVYIDDDISKDIEVVNIISDNLRLKTMNGIKNIFIKANQGNKQILNEPDIWHQIEEIIDELLDNQGMLVNMVDLRCFDNYTYAHSVNVAVLSLLVGISLGIRKDTLVQLGIGALLHDIGKVFVPKHILNKPGQLTDEEFGEMKKHCEYGYNYVKDMYRFSSASFLAIKDHHERYDGSGYPNQKEKEDISLFGSIIAVADVFDALVSERPYRKATTPSEAVEYIMAGLGTLFDPKIVSIFLRKIAPYPVGTTVNLSNNWVGIVVENHESLCLRPAVRIVKMNDKDVEPFLVSLKDDYNLLNVTISGIAEV